MREQHVKIDLKEVQCDENMNWNQVVEERAQCWNIMNKLDF
jgi:hypothetical protein